MRESEKKETSELSATGREMLSDIDDNVQEAAPPDSLVTASSDDRVVKHMPTSLNSVRRLNTINVRDIRDRMHRNRMSSHGSTTTRKHNSMMVKMATPPCSPGCSPGSPAAKKRLGRNATVVKRIGRDRDIVVQPLRNASGENRDFDRKSNFAEVLSCGEEAVEQLGPGVYNVMPASKDEMCFTRRSDQLSVQDGSEMASPDVEQATPTIAGQWNTTDGIQVVTINNSVFEGESSQFTAEATLAPTDDTGVPRGAETRRSRFDIARMASLPFAMAVKVNPTNSRSRRMICILLCVVVAVGIGLAISVGGGYTRTSRSDDNNEQSEDSHSHSFSQVGLDIDGDTTKGRFGNAVSMSDDGTLMAVADNEKVQVFRIHAMNTNSHIIGGENTARDAMVVPEIRAPYETTVSTPAGSFLFPPPVVTKISSDGKYVAVGWPQYDHLVVNGTISSNVGMVAVYELFPNEFSWQQVGDTIVGSEEGLYFGASLSLSDDGETLAAGAPGSPNSDSNGHAFVYRLVNGVWVPLGSLVPNHEALDLAVYSVCLSGDGNNVAVGGIPDSEEGSVAKVFQWKDGNWTERGSGIRHTIGDTSYLAELSADGSTVVVSNYFTTDAVSSTGVGLDVRAYSWSDAIGGWEPRGSNIHELFDTERSGYFISLSRDASRIAMGDPGSRYGDRQAAGQVQVVEFDGNHWVQIVDDIWGEAAGDQFGYAVSISGDGQRVAVSAPYNRGSGLELGRVKVYEIQES